MTHCSSCGREIPASAKICDECDRWATDSGAPLFLDEPSNVNADAPAPEPASPPFFLDEPPNVTAAPATQTIAPSVATGLRINRRELLAIVLAIVGGAIVVFALLWARGGPTAGVAAAVDTPTRLLSSVASSQPAPLVSPKWNSANSAYWVGNRRKSAAFELAADNTVSIWQGRVRPTLVVRCLSNSTQVFVFTGSAIKIEPKTEDHTVAFSFDDGQEVKERWPDSDEHDALFAPDGTAFARRLMGARTLKFAYTPHNASSVVTAFQVSGLTELIEPVAKECGWKK